MARAAAKRTPTDASPRRRRPPEHKDSGGQRFEDTLFFNRLRKQREVGVRLPRRRLRRQLRALRRRLERRTARASPTSSTGIRGGGSGQPSVEQGREGDAEEPEGRGGLERPGDRLRHEGRHRRPRSRPGRPTRRCARRTPTGSRRWRPTTSSSSTTQTQEAAAAQAEAQNAQATQFGPPPDLAARPRARTRSPIRSRRPRARRQPALQHGAPDAAGDRTAARRRLQEAREAAKPAEPSDQLQLAQAAQNAGDTAAAIAAYKTFIKLAPDDPNAAVRAASRSRRSRSPSQG